MSISKCYVIVLVFYMFFNENYQNVLFCSKSPCKSEVPKLWYTVDVNHTIVRKIN